MTERLTVTMLYSRGSKKVYQFLEDSSRLYGRFRKKRGYYEGMERGVLYPQ